MCNIVEEYVAERLAEAKAEAKAEATNNTLNSIKKPYEEHSLVSRKSHGSHWHPKIRLYPVPRPALTQQIST